MELNTFQATHTTWLSIRNRYKGFGLATTRFRLKASVKENSLVVW